MAWDTRFRQRTLARKAAEIAPVQQRRFEPEHVAHLRTLSPGRWLRDRGYTFDERLEDRGHIVIDKLYRIDLISDRWVACDWHGAGIGDNIALVQHDLGCDFVEAVEILGGNSRSTKSIESMQKAKIAHDATRPTIAAPTWNDVIRGRRYLHSRLIHADTIADAEACGFLRYVRSAVAFVGYDDCGRAGCVTLRSISPSAGLPKRDLPNSHKRFAPYLAGKASPTVHVVEGGVDALAVQSLAKVVDIEPPHVIVSSGAGSRSWMTEPRLESVLGSASQIIVWRDREATSEIQAETDLLYQKQVDDLAGHFHTSNIRMLIPPPPFKDPAQMLSGLLSAEVPNWVAENFSGPQRSCPSPANLNHNPKKEGHNHEQP
jgi:hypothetical protein